MAKPPVDAAADPLLPQAPPPQHYQPPPDLLLLLLHPSRRLPRRRRSYSCTLLLTTLLSLSLFLAAAIFVLWPSNPTLHVVRLRLDNLSVSPKPPISLDVALALKLRVRNPDFFALDYRTVRVSIGYRGRPLGNVTSGGGRVRARAVSYLDAELRLDGIQVLHDVFYLIKDYIRGSIPFDTVTEIKGTLRFFGFGIPIQGKISCVVHANPANHTIVRQDCYPE